MTIKELADAYICHSEEIDKGVEIYQRQAFKDGAKVVLREIEEFVFHNCATCGLTILNEIKRLRGE